MNTILSIKTFILAIILLACDSTLSRWDDVRVNIHGVNGSQSLIHAGDDIVTNREFSRRATTELSEQLSYSWSKVSGPGNIIFSAPQEQETSIAADQDGIYVIRVTARNQLGDETSDDFQLTWDTIPPVPPDTLQTRAGGTTGSDVRLTNQTTIVFAWNDAKDEGVGVRDYTITWYASGDCTGFESTRIGLQQTHHIIQGQDGDVFSFKVTAFDKLDQSQTSACSPSIRIDTSLPPALTAFTGVTGSQVGSTKLTLTLPPDHSDYNSITIRRSSGTSAPIDCSAGDSIKTYNKGALAASLVYVDAAPGAGAAYSYRACILDAAGNELGQNTAANIVSKDHYIFVTSGTTDGKFNVPTGGAAAADLTCLDSAVNSSQTVISEELKWRAIVSTSTKSAASSLQILGKVRATDVPTYTVVANNAAELWSGTLLTYIGNDENGAPSADPLMVWTGTLGDGSTAPQTCNDWTNNTIAQSAIVGDPGAFDNTWIGIVATETCNSAQHVYCISQR